MELLQSNKRIIYFDLLRIIAAFAVVVLHVSGDRFIESFPTNEWRTRIIYDSLVRWCVPIFFMISGALFLSRDKIDIKVLFSRNIVRIIFIFLFWSFFYALFEVNVEKGSGVIDVLRLTFEGPFHFWFLKILLGLYVIIPIIKVITQNKNIEEYFIITAILTAYFIPMLITFIGFYNEGIKSYLIWTYNEIGITIALGYVGYFVLGHYLCTYRIPDFLKKLIIVMGVISVLSVIVLTLWYSNKIKEPSDVFFNNLNIFTLFESLAVFLTIKDVKISENLYTVITKVSKLTLGVYLIHVFVYRFSDILFGINSNSFSYVYFIPCFSLIVFVVSCLITAVFAKVPILNKFIS